MSSLFIERLRELGAERVSDETREVIGQVERKTREIAEDRRQQDEVARLEKFRKDHLVPILKDVNPHYLQDQGKLETGSKMGYPPPFNVRLEWGRRDYGDGWGYKVLELYLENKVGSVGIKAGGDAKGTVEVSQENWKQEVEDRILKFIKDGKCFHFIP